MKISFSGLDAEQQQTVETFNAKVDAHLKAERDEEGKLETLAADAEEHSFAELQKACYVSAGRLFVLRKEAVKLAREREEILCGLRDWLESVYNAFIEDTDKAFDKTVKMLVKAGVGTGEFSAQERQRTVMANQSEPVRELRAKTDAAKATWDRCVQQWQTSGELVTQSQAQLLEFTRRMMLLKA